MSVALALLAMLIELCVGYPERVVRIIGHPVTWIGRLIAALDHTLNRDPSPAFSTPQARKEWEGARRRAGIVAVLIVLGVVGAIVFAIARALRLLPSDPLPYGFIATAILASTLIAQRSLYRHVADVANALGNEGLAAGRAAVSRIVGRDTATLDDAGVARAAIESLAENFSDGIVAPVLWMAVAGLPGAALYKTVNTADSMIGHRTPRHEAFGWAAARLDDLVNLPASRLSALMLIGAATLSNDCSAAEACRAVWRDASYHRSPNAGYPEAAVAGALGLALAGPRIYGGTLIDDGTMGEGRREANFSDIHRALALYRRADAILIVLVAILAGIVILLD